MQSGVVDVEQQVSREFFVNIFRGSYSRVYLTVQDEQFGNDSVTPF